MNEHPKRPNLKYILEFPNSSPVISPPEQYSSPLLHKVLYHLFFIKFQKPIAPVLFPDRPPVRLGVLEPVPLLLHIRRQIPIKFARTHTAFETDKAQCVGLVRRDPSIRAIVWPGPFAIGVRSVRACSRARFEGEFGGWNGRRRPRGEVTKKENECEGCA